MMQRLWVALFLLAVVVGVVLAQGAPAPSGAAAAAARSVTVDAFTAPHDQRQIASPIGSIVTNVLVEEGDRVGAGQEMVHLDDNLLRAQLAVSEARIQSAHAQIDAAKARHELLTTEFDREQKLFEKQVASQEDLDKARLDRDLAQLSIQNAENDLKIATLTAERDRKAADQTVIRAPIDGEVFRIAVRAGEAAEPLRPVLSMVTVDPLDVVAYVPIDTVGRIQPGTTASLDLEGLASGPLQCTVKVVDRVADPASGTYRVKLTLPNPDREVPAGARGSLTFVLTP
jgi:RND family efflux transporter MFP subunit